MKPRLNPSLNPRRQQAGSVLIIVLIFAGILTLVLGVYLNMTSTETKQSARSLVWNSALPMAEAGAEEALSHVTWNTNDFAVDNWTQQGTNDVYFKQRTLGSDKYSVVILGGPGAPVTIYSTGSVFSADSGTYVTRTVEVAAFAMSFPPPTGMTARKMTFGGSLTIDSYDSSVLLYCTPANDTTGFYDPAKATDIAFIGNPVGTISLSGNSHVYGYAASGVGQPVPTAGGTATISSKSYTGKNVQPGHATNGYVLSMPDVKVPFQSGSVPTNGTINGTNYTYVLTDGYYKAADLVNANYGKTMYVKGVAKLYVTGTLDLSAIVFTNGARLDIYLAQDNVLVPTVVGAPTQLIVWGLNTCTSIKLVASAKFVGVIYAPRAFLQAAGSAQVYGAITADEFKSTGSFEFHHDLGSGKTTPPKPFAIQGWRELTTPGS